MKKSLFKSIGLLILTTHFSLCAEGVDSVMEHTITKHPEIRAKYHNFISSLEDQNIARGQLRPQLTAQTWIGREWRNNYLNDGKISGNRPGWNVEFKQLIFDGGVTTENIRQWGYEKLSVYYELMDSTNNVAYEVAVAYLDVQRYRKMRSLARQNLIVHSNTLAQIRERQSSGVGRGVDLEQANGRLALAQTNLMTETNNLNDVNQRYRRLYGNYPVENMPEVPDISAYLVLDPENNFAKSLRNNPGLLAKQAMVQAADAGAKAAKKTHSPTVELRAGAGKDRSESSAFQNSTQSAHVQVLLTYNFYRGGADQARMRQTISQANAAADLVEYHCRNIQQELSIAWNNISKLQQQMPFLLEHQMSMSKVRVAYQQQFQLGQRSLLDVLDTENELFDAQRSAINAEYDFKKFQLKWLALSNKLLEAFKLAAPNAGDLPEEQQSMIFPEDQLRACTGAAPNANNLLPELNLLEK